MSFTALITVTFIIVIVYEIWRRSRSQFGLPKARFSWPMPIQILHFLSSKDKFGERLGGLVSRYRPQLGNLFVVPFFGRDYVVLSGEEAINWAIKNEKDDKYTRRNNGNIERILQSKVTRDVGFKRELWKRDRDLFSRLLMQSNVLNNFIPIMVEVIQRHLSQIKAIDGETSSAIVMEIGWLFIMGKRALNVKDLVSQHYKEIKSAFMAIPLNIPGLALNKGIKAREKIADIINHILNSDPFAKSDPNCCLGGIAEAHGHDGIEVEIRILGLLFAATETTVGVTNGILWHLIENPTVLNKLQKEIRETPEPKTLTDFHNFPYLNKVIHEGLRLYGVDVVIRESKEGLKYNNIYFPAGTYFAVTMGYEHQSVPDPKHFNPDREENYKWEPFGTPARSCIGRAFALLEMKMILYQTLKNYNVTGEKLENASIRQGLNVKLFNARLKLEPVSETIS